MDLLGVMRACLRRWYVFLPIVLLTAWLARDQYQQARPQYTSVASVVIAPSSELVYNRGRQTETGLVVTSPFNGGDGPRVLAGLLARALNTTTIRQQLLPAGGVALTADRNVEEDVTVVNLQVVAADAKTAAASLEAVRAGANGVLSEIQLGAGTPEGQLFNAVSGGPVDPPLVAYPDRVRGVVAIALAGLLLAVVLSVVAQSLMAGRRKRTEKTPKTPKAATSRTKEPRTKKDEQPRSSGKRGTGRRVVASHGPRRGGARGRPVEAAGTVAPTEEVDVREPSAAPSR